MTSKGLGEMFEVDMCAGKCPVMLMGGRAGGLSCADMGVRTTIGVSGNFYDVLSFVLKAGITDRIVVRYHII